VSDVCGVYVQESNDVEAIRTSRRLNDSSRESDSGTTETASQTLLWSEREAAENRAVQIREAISEREAAEGRAIQIREAVSEREAAQGRTIQIREAVSEREAVGGRAVQVQEAVSEREATGGRNKLWRTERIQVREPAVQQEPEEAGDVYADQSTCRLPRHHTAQSEYLLNPCLTYILT
jgi:hypothetical protein